MSILMEKTLIKYAPDWLLYHFSLTFRSSHLSVTDNQKRWLVAGIALSKILTPQIRPFLEQEVNKEYNSLKTSHNIHAQSTSCRLQRWPPRKFLKYENINGNDRHLRLPGGRPNYSLFDCRVTSHIDFARLYVENYMAKFHAFDDHCDASAVLSLLGGVPVFSAAVRAAAGDIRIARNDWAHCVFRKWDQAKFQQSFTQMEHLVRVMALPAADEGKILGELKDWETKGIHLCMNSPVDKALLQLVQQQLKSLQDDVGDMSVEFESEKREVQQELRNVAVILEEMKQRVETGQQSLECRTGLVEERVTNMDLRINDLKGDASERFGKLETAQQNTESRTGQVESRMDNVENRMEDFQEKVDDLMIRTKEATLPASCQDINLPAAIPEKLVELIKRDYKGAVLCPFPWCEDELQLKLSNVFTKLLIRSRTKERSLLTNDTVDMTDVFRPHVECSKPRVVLIEGDPGMGKTTYCEKLACDWSVGDIPPEALFSEVGMLLLLKCRDMNMKTANIEEAIDDQLLPQDVDKKEKETFLHFIRSNQSRILLILDGLDELRQDLLQGFLPLIQGKVFSNINLVLTARHEAGMKVRRYCDTLLEIAGYTHSDADSYIRKYFSNHKDRSLAYKMIEQLHFHQQLRELTSSPLYTALLCLVFEDTGGVFPSNRPNCKLYDALVSCALRRYFAKRGVSLDGEDPIERYADQLNQLGKMAFEALLKDQLYFSENEMKCKSADFLKLCFLSRQPSASKIRPTPCFAFTHKTFQEYFAAFHVAHQLLSGDKKSEFLLPQLIPIGDIGKHWQVWQFLFSMITIKNSEMAVFLVSRLCAAFNQERTERTIDVSDDASSDASLDFIIGKDKPYDWEHSIGRWSQNEREVDSMVIQTLNVIAECEDSANELKDYQKKMVVELARCFPVYKLLLFISRSRYCSICSEYLKASYTLTDLHLYSNYDNDLLLPTIHQACHSEDKLLHLTLHSISHNPYIFSPTPPSFVRWLANVFQPGRVLTHFILRCVQISDAGVQVLSDVFKLNRTLTHLKLDSAMIRDQGATVLASGLKSNCTLTHLSLPRNWISGRGAEDLAKGLQKNRSLKYLDLSENLGGDSVAEALASVLESKCPLACLDLSQSLLSTQRVVPFLDSDAVHFELIGESGASALARALQLNCSLTCLYLTCNDIKDPGATAFGETLQSNCTLTQLYLKDNMISDSGAEGLAQALQPNHTLTHLDLSENDIGDSGAETLRKAQQANQTLTHLDLLKSENYRHIGDCLELGRALRKPPLSNLTLQWLREGIRFEVH